MNNTLSLAEIQHIGLEILKAIDTVCRDNGLHFFLAYGTLLGAARHHGPIPWDDDVDILMPRSDYCKLCDVFNKSCNGYYLATAENTPSYTLPYAKVFDLSTSSKEKGIKLQEPNGVFVDIFPMDPVPSSERLRKKQDRIIRWHWRRLQFALYHQIHEKQSRKWWQVGMFISMPFPKSFSFRKGDINQYCREFTKALTDFNNSHDCTEKDAMRVCIDEWESRVVFQVEDFMSGHTLPYMDTELPVPSGYKMILTDTYGDYMKLPPEKDRFPSHYEWVIRR